MSAAMLLAGACGQNPTPSVQPTGQPQVGWVVMAGDRDTPDRDFVCQSNPRSECVIPASRPNEPTFAHVHFYLHAASADVHFEGTVQVGFLQGQPSGHVVNVNAVTRAGDDPSHQSVVGIVTDRPGAHPMKIAVDAKPVTGSGAARALHEDVPVTVR